MITISLCMIVKNEESILERCLDSVEGIADEIIIVDTGSTDRTKEVASLFTDKIYDFEWVNDFSAARNFSFEKAVMDYIMWLDADDIILSKDAEELIALKENLSADVDAVMMKYNTEFDQHGNVTFSYFRERLAKRSRCFKWREPVHEYLEVGGKIINADICVTHAKRYSSKSGRNIQIYEDILEKGNELSSRGMYYYARELKEHGRYPEAIRWYNAFLDAGRGWTEDNINACGDMARCYQAENNHAEALAALLRSFAYDVPSAEICCQIGYYFKELGKYKQAVFWFGFILNLERPKENWGFRQEDCWGYIPCIESAVCYDKLGEYEKAAGYNERAAVYKPGDTAVLYNKRYFSERLSKA